MLLGHALPKITRTYNTATYDRDKREAVTLLGVLVARAAGLPPAEAGKVTPMRRRRGGA
jgi:hypothetical protein